MICPDSKAHHSAYFRKRALEEARGATFAEIPRFCNLIIIIRGFSIMAGQTPLLGISKEQLM